MKTRYKLTKLITRTMATAALAAGLLCGAGWLQPVEAQTSDGSVKFVSYTSIGIVNGQRVSLSVANTTEPAGTVFLSFQYYLAHGTNSSTSVPFYESGWIKVPPGEMRSSGVSRGDLTTEGEPGTGRAEIIAKATVIAPAGSKPVHVPGSLEVIEDEVESRAILDFKNGSEYRVKIVYQPAVDDETSMPSGLSAPISFLPGQRLSYSFINPKEEGSQTVRVGTYTYDAANRLVAQTHPVELRPGETYISNIDRDDLHVAGDERTGRLLVRVEIRIELMNTSERAVSVPVWMELVDKPTGSTISGSGGNYFTGTVSVSGDGF